jgi:C4-type Zn-finger protein
MATVGEICWHHTNFGKCPHCGRERPLGELNTTDVQQELCIDCYFGPPMEYWEQCEECGQLFVGVHCDNPKCLVGSKWNRKV